jgi:hypothetical protein
MYLSNFRPKIFNGSWAIEKNHVGLALLKKNQENVFQ